MKNTSNVAVLYKLYRLCIGESESSGIPISDGAHYFSPLPFADEDNLWIEIVPGEQKPETEYRKSVKLCIYNPAQHTLKSCAQPYVELQAQDSDGQQALQKILMFQCHSSIPITLMQFFSKVRELDISLVE